MRRVLALAAVLLMAGTAAADDPWEPVRFLEGDWIGKAEGKPGVGTVKRSYSFVLGKRFLHERNVSTYAKEVHEHWSFLSYDRVRKRLMLRQFHQEGFVNEYVFVPELSTATKLVFETESIENLPPNWRARETYDIHSRDEFTETFELARPGGKFEVYARTAFKRARS